MMTCFLKKGGTTPRMLRLDPTTGDVYERPIRILEDGRLAYSNNWSEAPIYNFNGVLGWCACDLDAHGKAELMGMPLMSVKGLDTVTKEIFYGKKYVKEEFKRLQEQVSWCGGHGAVYVLCLECGKIFRDVCLTPDDFLSYVEKLGKLDTSQGFDLRETKLQSADFSRLPDGEIVVKGICKCSSPCVIRANCWTYVCSACGRLIIK